MSQLRIFIADPSRDSRLAMQMLLEHEPGLKVVGIGVQLDGLVKQISAVTPNVILLEWQLINPKAAEVIGKLRAKLPPCLILILAIRPDAEEAAIKAGGDYFICKNSPPDTLLQVLRQQKLKR